MAIKMLHIPHTLTLTLTFNRVLSKKVGILDMFEV